MPFADHPVRRVAAAEGVSPGPDWPHTIPAVRQLLTDGLDLDPGVTCLVGENGTGKSTLVEAIAIAFGITRGRLPRYYTYLEQNPGVYDPKFHELSHGEGFLEVLRSRFDSPGLYCLDEPESALSFSSSLALVGVLNELTDGRSQVLCATHSPVVCSLPGATILEIGEWGIRRTTWAELELVQTWRAYLDAPDPLPAAHSLAPLALGLALLACLG